MLVKIKNGPSSSRWSFRGVRNGYEIWVSNSGKSFYKRVCDGQWFRFAKKEA